MSDPRLHLLGIRHHGPGSAASVFAALEQIDPECVLIEGPPDADAILGFADKAGMRPPVAILVYAEDDPARSVFYPFATFSPEWQAIQWALAHRRTVRFIDLPVRYRLAELDVSDEEDQQSNLRRDPLTELALAAGESDGESWWNGLVEQTASGPEVFAAIGEAMAVLRTSIEQQTQVPILEERREAHMRTEIATALSATAGSIAVVCGAWHVPALRQAGDVKKDRQSLKGLPQAKTVATWVPWTDMRLAAASGYGAGIISPGWYRHLWSEFHIKGQERQPLQVAARWQVQVARLLREEGLPAATASIIEASRLAVSLASVRGFPLPGLGEMQDASLSVLCHGDDLLLKLIGRKLVIGDDIGEIDDSIPQMPLAEDLQRWQRKLRMKPSPAEEEMAVDLRTETGLQKSALLHRLLLIDVPWGRMMHAQAGRGTFREVWTLVWQPELSVKLVEALHFGTTIAQAAENAALAVVEKQPGLARVSGVIGTCLNADLPEAAEKLTVELQRLSVSSSDIAQLMLACVPLIRVLRYGTARKIPRGALSNLVTGMSAEICAGLVPASCGLSDDAVATMYMAMQQYDTAIPLFEDQYGREAWLEALGALEQSDASAAFLRGFALRHLYDSQQRGAGETATRLSRALSNAVPTQEAGQWLEGFLGHSAQLLLNDAQLFQLIDDWLAGLTENSFMELLPVLRRAVTSFDPMERRHILEQVKRGPAADTKSRAALAPDDPRAAEAFVKALPLIKTILGLSDDTAI